jgi:hypothetical protein
MTFVSAANGGVVARGRCRSWHAKVATGDRRPLPTGHATSGIYAENGISCGGSSHGAALGGEAQ